MTPATFLHEAEIELWKAAEYYESKSPGLGLDFLTEVETSIESIRRFPQQWPVREDGTRRCLVHRFPYLVVYMYLKQHIWILAIAHCKRRPHYWKDRISGAERLSRADD